jgi:heme/copper-type cytochrome/quinol oxidase subunit 2
VEGVVSLRLSRSGSRLPFGLIGAALLAFVGVAVVMAEQARREFEVTARRYSFSVAGSDAPEIRVMQNDLVHVTFSTEDIPHSFTIEDAPYRIMKRAEPGKPVSFDFRADQPGRFRFFCSLTADEKCRDMSGTLVVTPR